MTVEFDCNDEHFKYQSIAEIQDSCNKLVLVNFSHKVVCIIEDTKVFNLKVKIKNE